MENRGSAGNISSSSSRRSSEKSWPRVPRPEKRREVIDRAAAPAPEAIPATTRLPIHVQAGRPVIVEQAAQLAGPPDPQPGSSPGLAIGRSIKHASASGAGSSQAAAPTVVGGSASAVRARAKAGSTRRSAGNPVTGGARRGATGNSGQSATRTVAVAGGSSSRDGGGGATRSGVQQSARPALPARPSGTLGRLVKELPTAVLFALLAFGVIAAAMALNAYLQSRRAKALAGQRAALLSDLGVLQAALLPAVPEKLGDLACLGGLPAGAGACRRRRFLRRVHDVGGHDGDHHRRRVRPWA